MIKDHLPVSPKDSSFVERFVSACTGLVPKPVFPDAGNQSVDTGAIAETNINNVTAEFTG
jgi:hypothetical protein